MFVDRLFRLLCIVAVVTCVTIALIISFHLITGT